MRIYNVAPELSELILHRTSGNPLFTEEFIFALIETGHIRKKNNTYYLIRGGEGINVPDSIQGLIASRIDRLDENIKRTIQVASVIGRDFVYRILKTITGMQKDLKAYLLKLQRLEFIYEKNVFPELEYIFRHALTQEVAYNSLLLKNRKKIHSKIGSAIEYLYSSKLIEYCEILAYHYSKSDNPDKALTYMKLAGDKATRNYSLRAAYDFYDSAIKTLKKLPQNSGTEWLAFSKCRHKNGRIRPFFRVVSNNFNHLSDFRPSKLVGTQI